MKRIRAAAISAAFVVLVGAASVPLLVSPALRVAEASENGASKERHEQASTVGRFEHLRHLNPQPGRSANLSGTPAWPSRGGHTQHFVVHLPRGHRLANGLLAPLTC